MTDPGSFSWTKGITWPTFESTWGKVSGFIENPVVGRMKHIDDIVLRDRIPRARIWKYFPDGIPANAFGTSPDGEMRPPSAITSPCMIATPLKISEVPVNPDTGFPDIDKFMSNGFQGQQGTGSPIAPHFDL